MSRPVYWRKTLIRRYYLIEQCFLVKCFFGIAVFVLHNFVCRGYSNIQKRVKQGFRYWSTYKTGLESSSLQIPVWCDCFKALVLYDLFTDNVISPTTPTFSNSNKSWSELEGEKDERKSKWTWQPSGAAASKGKNSVVVSRGIPYPQVHDIITRNVTLSRTTTIIVHSLESWHSFEKHIFS